MEKHNHSEIDKIKTGKRGEIRVWRCDKCNKIIIKGKKTNKYHNLKESTFNHFPFYKILRRLNKSILTSLTKKYKIRFDKDNIAHFQEKEKKKDEKRKDNVS